VECNLVEIFASAQGEGPTVGSSTIFVRFGECDLRCDWCDSPGTWRPARQWRLEVEPGSARFSEHPNPATLDRIVAGLEALDVARHRYLSLTGGEPLLQAAAVAALLERLEGTGPRLLLETHGLAVDAFETVRERVDIVSMDWKLERDVRWAKRQEAEERASFDDLHERFLQLARETCDVYVKIVVVPHTRAEELNAVCSRIAAVDRGIPLILQPVTPMGRIKEGVEPAAMLGHLRACEERLDDVRIIPQTHRMYHAL
jgi:organic radical activating enzyme